MGKCGYVANSPFTIKGESMSAGRLYDKLGDKAKGKILYVVPGGAICMITKTGLGTADTDSKHTNKSMEKMMIPEADGDEEVILIFTVG